MKPQIIKRDGKPEYAVIRYADYRKLKADAEMLADVMAFDAAKGAVRAGQEELLPATVVDRLLDDENPVKVWREYRQMTAAELAAACGVSPPAISQIEAGKRKPSVALLQKIASVLGLDLDDLVPVKA